MKKTPGDTPKPSIHTKFHENRSIRFLRNLVYIQTDTQTQTWE